MKRLALIISLLLIFAGCKKDDSILAKEATMRVNAYRQACYGVGSQTCYLVQEDDLVNSNYWKLFYDSIEGFQYEEGYIYTLKVRIQKVPNPPADASDRKYILLEVLHKEKV